MYKKIMVPVDFNQPEVTDLICSTAEQLAKLSDAEIHLVTVLPDYGTPLVASFFPKDAQDNLQAEVTAQLSKLAAEKFTGKVSARIKIGKRAKKILEEMTEWQPDLIIVGCRPKKSQGDKHFMGSCSTSVSNRATCPVLVVR